jgi:hypothetical protein
MPAGVWVACLVVAASLVGVAPTATMAVKVVAAVAHGGSNLLA